MNKGIVRKSDIGAPPARMSAGAPPTLPAFSVRRARGFGNRSGTHRTPLSSRKRRFEENLDVEESDSDQSTAPDDPENTESCAESTFKEEEVEEKDKEKKRPRKKRRFRLTDATAKSKRRAEKRAQLALEAEQAAKIEVKEEASDLDMKKKSPTPPPVQKPPMVRTYSPMQLLCDNLLRRLQSKDPDEYFCFPVTQSIAPDYHSIIQQPMDFSTMRMKIENNEYSDIAAFREDVVLIMKNALEYNEPNTVYYVAAQKLDQLIKYYFDEHYLRYLYHTLPFAKDIPLEKMGLKPKSRPRPLPKVNRQTAIEDTMTTADIINGSDKFVRDRLSARVPNLRRIVPHCENGKEPKCELSFIDNKDGATCLNVINSTNSERTVLKLGDLVGKLEEGTPGLFAPQESKVGAQVPISYLSYGPFSSFAPQFDSTWANLNERDSRLLLSTYGDKQNAINVLSLRHMVEDAGEHMIKVVDDLLDSLSDGEHRRTLEALEDPIESAKVPDLKNAEEMRKILESIETLENIGIDVSFVNDIRKQYCVEPPANTPENQLNKTGAMLKDLALLQKNRLSSLPPSTLSDQPPPSSLELNLAAKVQDQLQSQISHFAKPGDLISSPVIHSAVGLNEEDLDLLNEFFTPGTV